MSKDAKHYRLFVALPVPTSVKESMATLQKELRGRVQGKEIRWARPEQSHLTLAFLGDVAIEKVDALKEELRKVAEKFAAIPLHAERLGFFPNVRSPRVVWVWVHDDRGELALLQREVASACVAFGAKDEGREFTGHLTLGRMEGLPKAQVKLLGDVAREMEGRVLGDWRAETLDLMRSELGPGGSKYTCLESFPLSRG